MLKQEINELASLIKTGRKLRKQENYETYSDICILQSQLVNDYKLTTYEQLIAHDIAQDWSSRNYKILMKDFLENEFSNAQPIEQSTILNIQAHACLMNSGHSISIPSIKLEIVRENRFFDKKFENIKSPEIAAELMHQIFQNSNREEAYILFLDYRLHPLGFSHISSGSTNEALIPLNEIIKRALLTNSDNLMLFHNHPSGSLNMSYHDRHIIEAISKMAEQFNISLIDSIVLCDGDSYLSARYTEPELFKPLNNDIYECKVCDYEMEIEL